MNGENSICFLLRLIVVINRIHILGASGSGTTTLVKLLSMQLSIRHMDCDDYFWKTKFSESWPADMRLKLLTDEIKKQDNWILSGATIPWGNSLTGLYDLVIFLSVSNEVRLKRLREREMERWGDRALPGNDKHEHFLKFMEWANLYECGGLNVRSRKSHDNWLEGLKCPILRLSGTDSTEERAQKVLEYIR